MRQYFAFLSGIAVSLAANLATALNKAHATASRAAVIMLFLSSGWCLFSAATRAERSERSELQFTDKEGSHRSELGVRWRVAVGVLAFLAATLFFICSVANEAPLA